LESSTSKYKNADNILLLNTREITIGETPYIGLRNSLL
jgi:hypothetical protein